MNRALNEQQLAAINVQNKNALVLAGAGSGKTFTIIERVSKLLAENVDPKRILVLTFTRRAANELVQRLALKHGEKAQQIKAGTFHSFCLLAIRSRPDLFENLSKMVIIDRDDQLSLLRQVRTDWLNEKKADANYSLEYLKALAPKVEELIRILSYSRSKNIGLREYLKNYHGINDDKEFNDNHGPLATLQICNDYELAKKQRRLMDFDDILIEFAKALELNSGLRDYYKAQFDHILVDEIQDTNSIQWLILLALSGKALLFCVGDDAQNIYGFRGATPEITNHFLSRIENSQRLKLTINYRSTTNILKLANFILARSTIKYDKELISTRTQGKVPVLKDFLNREKEARWIVDDIKSKLSNGASLKDFMLLTRSAWNVKTIEAILIEQSISYVFIGGASLLNAAHVKDLLAIVRASFNFSDDIAWLRWLTKYPKLGEISARKIQLQIKNKQPAEAAEIVKKAFAQGNLVANSMLELIKLENTPAELLVKALEDNEKLFVDSYPDWQKRKNELIILIDLAQGYKNIHEFMQNYSIDPITASEGQAKGDNQLKLITIHSAKGLESKYCYIVGAQRGSFPHSRSISTEEIEEERRILYVAITRSIDELTITRALDSNFNDGKEYFIEPLLARPDIVNYQKLAGFF